MQLPESTLKNRKTFMVSIIIYLLFFFLYEFWFIILACFEARDVTETLHIFFLLLFTKTFHYNYNCCYFFLANIDQNATIAVLQNAALKQVINNIAARNTYGNLGLRNPLDATATSLVLPLALQQSAVQVQNQALQQLYAAQLYQQAQPLLFASGAVPQQAAVQLQLQTQLSNNPIQPGNVTNPGIIDPNTTALYGVDHARLQQILLSQQQNALANSVAVNGRVPQGTVTGAPPTGTSVVTAQTGASILGEPYLGNALQTHMSTYNSQYRQANRYQPY